MYVSVYILYIVKIRMSKYKRFVLLCDNYGVINLQVSHMQQQNISRKISKVAVLLSHQNGSKTNSAHPESFWEVSKGYLMLSHISGINQCYVKFFLEVKVFFYITLKYSNY